MAEFYCRNEECKNKDVQILNGNVTYRMHGMSLLADERFCKECGAEMEEIKKHSGTQGFNISEWGSPDKQWSNPGHRKPIY